MVSVHQPDDLLSAVYDGMHIEKTKLPRYSKNAAKDLESIQRIPCSLLGFICHRQGTKCIYRISEIRNKGDYCLHFLYIFAEILVLYKYCPCKLTHFLFEGQFWSLLIFVQIPTNTNQKHNTKSIFA